MANNPNHMQNLKPFTKEDRERTLINAKKGAKASAEKAKKKKTIKEIVEMVVRATPPENIVRQLESLGIPKEEIDILTAMTIGVSQKATKSGDAKAFKTIVEYMGEDERLNRERIKFEQEMKMKEQELEYRRRELELREKEFEHRLAIERGEVKEEDKVYIVNDLDELSDEKE